MRYHAQIEALTDELAKSSQKENAQTENESKITEEVDKPDA